MNYSFKYRDDKCRGRIIKKCGDKKINKLFSKKIASLQPAIFDDGSFQNRSARVRVVNDSKSCVTLPASRAVALQVSPAILALGQVALAADDSQLVLVRGRQINCT